MAKPKKYPKPDGSSKQIIVQCDKPFLKFTVPTKEWIELQKEEEEGTIHMRNPRLIDPNAGTFMTEKMLKAMTHSFDGYGEFKTKDEVIGKAAYKAALQHDRFARLASTSIYIEVPVDKEEEEDEDEAA